MTKYGDDYLGKYVLDDDGNPRLERSAIRWGIWLETSMESRRVADDTVCGQRVSTVFLGLDHNFSGVGPPVLWETIVFDAKGESTFCDRYSSLEAAKRGHRKAMKMAAKESN